MSKVNFYLAKSAVLTFNTAIIHYSSNAGAVIVATKGALIASL
jgi:hypothetical protein